MSININVNGQSIPLSDKNVSDIFHVMYYDSKVWADTHWFGHQILKCPLDMWMYQEIFNEIKPDYVIECGTFRGGSALYYAHLFDLMGHGEIITIDIEPRENLPVHPRIHYMTGSSSDMALAASVEEIICQGGTDKKVVVLLDSDHSYQHVLAEMHTWHHLVSRGSYMIVEDSNVNGFPVRPDFGPGPMEAINEFMSVNNDFEIDLSREKFFMTQNPRGYLKKK
jgi:cephalosporin hydroxylase